MKFAALCIALWLAAIAVMALSAYVNTKALGQSKHPFQNTWFWVYR